MRRAVVPQQAGNEAKCAGRLLHLCVRLVVAIRLDELRYSVKDEAELNRREHEDIHDAPGQYR